MKCCHVEGLRTGTHPSFLGECSQLPQHFPFPPTFQSIFPTGCPILVTGGQFWKGTAPSSVGAQPTGLPPLSHLARGPSDFPPILGLCLCLWNSVSLVLEFDIFFWMLSPSWSLSQWNKSKRHELGS